MGCFDMIVSAPRARAARAGDVQRKAGIPQANQGEPPMRAALPATTLIVVLSFAGSAKGDFDLNFDFTNGTQGIQSNNPQAFQAEGAGNSGYTITAFGAGPNTAGQTTQLYVKSAGGDESGLGLTNDPTGEHEVSPGSYLRVDFSALKAQVGARDVTFQIGSVQAHEGFALFGSNTADWPPSNDAPLWTAINTTGHSSIYTTTFSADLIAPYNYFFLTAITDDPVNYPNPNVLLNVITVHSVHEPGSMALLGVGLAGMSGMAWKRRRGATSG
jgi:hypothetical protein